MNEEVGAVAIVVDLDNAAALIKELRLRGDERDICYVGYDAVVREELKKSLPRDNRLVSFDTSLDVIADRTRHLFIEIDELLLDPVAPTDGWAASNIAHTSPYAGDFLVRMYQVLSILDWHKTGGNRLYVVDNADFGMRLAEALAGNGVDAKWQGTTSSTNWTLRGLRGRLSAFRSTYRFKRAIRRARRRCPSSWEALCQCDILVFDWAEPEAGRKWRESSVTRNLGDVGRMLSADGSKVGFVALPLYALHPYARIAESLFESDAPILAAQELVTWRGTIKAAWQSWLLRRASRSRVLVEGYDLSSIVDLSWQEDLASDLPILSGAFIDVARKLSERGVKPRAIILPFENQGWEKVIWRSFRRYLPETRLVSYQYSAFAKRYISFFPTRSELKKNLFPDVLLTMGDHYTNTFQGEGIPVSRLRTFGSTMFRIDEQVNVPVGDRRQDSTVRILCSTSIKYSEALDLTIKLVGALERFDGVEVVLNFHPVFDEDNRSKLIDELAQRFGSVMHRVHIKDGRTRDILGDIDVVCFNTTGAVFDALLAGVRVAYVPIDGYISLNKVPEVIASVSVCDSDHSIDLLLVDLIESSKRSSVPVRQLDLSTVFSPVSAEVLLSATQEPKSTTSIGHEGQLPH